LFFAQEEELYLYLCKKGIKTMTTIDLKKLLVQRIAEINDITFLKALKTILDSKTATEVITLTPEQRNEIIASKMEIEKGLSIGHELLDKEVRGWLSEK
jgi:hypothetical protein